MIFQHGFPSVVHGEFGYFQAVQGVGFADAHRQMLVEVKKWFEDNLPHQSAFTIALEVVPRSPEFSPPGGFQLGKGERYPGAGGGVRGGVRPERAGDRRRGNAPVPLAA